MPEEYLHKDKEELVAENLQLKAALSKKEAELAELKRLIFGRKSEQNADTEGKNIFIAPLPSRVIDKGIPSAGLLAYILVSKFIGHLPYYRIIQIFKRAGMNIPASTVNGLGGQMRRTAAGAVPLSQGSHDGTGLPHGR